MNNFDTTVSIVLTTEDFKSAAAAGLLGFSALTGHPTGSQAVPPPQAITQNTQPSVDFSRLIPALEMVESKGKSHPIGSNDNGNAKGILQIWDVVIQDVNRVYKTNYVHDDAFDPVKARDICQKYLTHYGKVYTRKTGSPPTYKALARIWNGGPNGYTKPSTQKYWNKVQKVLKITP